MRMVTVSGQLTASAPRAISESLWGIAAPALRFGRRDRLRNARNGRCRRSAARGRQMTGGRVGARVEKAAELSLDLFCVGRNAFSKSLFIVDELYSREGGNAGTEVSRASRAR